MADEFEAMEVEDASPEFTFAEIIEMEKLCKETRVNSIGEQLCREISAKFNSSTYRSEKSPIKWEQVQNWFQDKQMRLAPAASSPTKEIVVSKTAVIRKRAKVPTISASEAASQLSNLMYEAQSAKDSAWFDVGTFLTYKFLCSGAGCSCEICWLWQRGRRVGKRKEGSKERSIPLEPSECDKVEVGDLVLCFREGSDHALYGDARVVEIERKVHDSSSCTCIFVVRYNHDNAEGKVMLNRLCCRPGKAVSKAATTLSWCC